MLFRGCFGMKNSNDDDSDNTLNCNTYHHLRRSKKSKFESLPNELLFIIFEYLYCHDIIYAFNKLSSRLQFLLHSYEYYHLDLGHETMKSKFNLIQQLPLNTQHIKSLMLSNNDHSSIDIAQCLSMYPLELFYSKLQSLSIVDNDNNRLLSLIFLLPNFQQLKYLLISPPPCFHLGDSDTTIQIRNIILFEIKTLKYLTWNVRRPFFYPYGRNATLMIKSNIEHYEFYSMNFKDLIWLKLHTVNMKSINIHNPTFPKISRRQQTFDRLISLKLNNIHALREIQFLFEHLTYLNQLQRLELQGDFHQTKDSIDGYQMENFIEKYIPQLKIFKFFFILSKSVTINILDELIESFMNEFWLIKKRWFIAYDYAHRWDYTYMYTIPCIKDELKYPSSWQQKSTTVKNTLNIRQLTLYTNHIERKIWHAPLSPKRIISDDITYEQLTTVFNMSSIKYVEFVSPINSKLFFDILKHNSRDVSIEIDYYDLREILRRTTYLNRLQIIYQLKQIKRLTITYDKRPEQELSTPLIKLTLTICYLFPNIEELIINRTELNSSELIYLLNHLKHLSFLSVYCHDLQTVGNDNIQQWVNQQSTRLNKMTFISKLSNSMFYIWIDSVMN